MCPFLILPLTQKKPQRLFCWVLCQEEGTLYFNSWQLVGGYCALIEQTYFENSQENTSSEWLIWKTIFNIFGSLKFNFENSQMFTYSTAGMVLVLQGGWDRFMWGTSQSARMWQSQPWWGLKRILKKYKTENNYKRNQWRDHMSFSEQGRNSVMVSEQEPKYHLLVPTNACPGYNPTDSLPSTFYI